jgi:hypothetical protein
MGYRVAPDSGENFSELKIRSCPVADVNRFAPIIQVYNRLKSGLVSLTDLYPHPSCALIESIDIISVSVDEAQRRATERALKEKS